MGGVRRGAASGPRPRRGRPGAAGADLRGRRDPRTARRRSVAAGAGRRVPRSRPGRPSAPRAPGRRPLAGRGRALRIAELGSRTTAAPPACARCQRATTSWCHWSERPPWAGGRLLRRRLAPCVTTQSLLEDPQHGPGRVGEREPTTPGIGLDGRSPPARPQPRPPRARRRRPPSTSSTSGPPGRPCLTGVRVRRPRRPRTPRGSRRRSGRSR